MHGESYVLLIATNAELMRAIDYRSPNLGLALVIAKSFEHPRQAQQGLGRVGRNSDPCQRVKLTGVPLVDPKKEFEYRTKLYKYYSENVARRFIVKDNNKNRTSGAK